MSRLRLRAGSFAPALVLLAIPAVCGATMPPRPGVSGDAIAAAAEHRLFNLDPVASGVRTSAATTWHLPVVLVSFADDTLVYNAPDFQRMLFDTARANPNGSFVEYYRWASGGRVQITGRVVAKVRLPQPQNYYANNFGGVQWYTTPNNSLGFARDALRLCQAGVPWPEFDLNYDGAVDMVWFVHAGVGAEGGNRSKLWSFTSRMTADWQNAGLFETTVPQPGVPGRAMVLDRFTILPELSLFHAGQLSEIGVFCHEFGHALGLPDLYDVSRPSNTGPGNWSLMSTGTYGGNNVSPDVPTHLGAWPLRYLGWDRPLRPSRDTTITIGPLARSREVIDVWFQGATSIEHFLVENRQKVDYDRNLPGEGLVLYQLDESIIGFGIVENVVNAGPIPGVRLIEGDADADLPNGQNRGDSNDPLPGSLGVTRVDDFTSPSLKSYRGALTNVSIEEIQDLGLDMRCRVYVRPKGWRPSTDVASSGYAPYPTRGVAHVSGRDTEGTAYLVTNEYVLGRPQILLRSSLAWNAPLQLSATTGAALDPALAILPTGDLAVVWSDSRSGRFEIYYRARIRGVWTAERSILSLQGNCRSPDIAADGRSELTMVCQHQVSDRLEVLYERFTYASAIGQPVVVAGPPAKPHLPTVHVGSDGRGFIMWQDRRPPSRLWLAETSPDSGVQWVDVMEPYPAPQVNYTATLDPDGKLHVIWLVSASLTGEMWYSVRIRGTDIQPGQALLSTYGFEIVGSPVINLALSSDAEGSLHLAYDAVTSSGSSLRYRRRWPHEWWDVASSDLLFGDIGGSQPVVLPTQGGDVTLMFTGVVQQQPHLFQRERRLTTSPLLLSSSAAVAADRSALRIEPNPARPGSPMSIRASLPSFEGPALLDFYDVSGRRVASLPLVSRGTDVLAAADWTPLAGRPDGVYFVRLRGTPGGATRLVLLR